MPLAPVLWKGRVPYAAALAEMRERREALVAGDESRAAILLLEHPPVITLGRHGSREHLRVDDSTLAQRGIEVHRIERGGDITYHGPGQLLVYPILRIGIRVSAFLSAIAGALSQVSASYGLAGLNWQRSPAGLFCGDKKIAACGIHVKRGVSLHGFAYNVATAPDAWQLIVPCGIPHGKVTSLSESLDAPSCPSIEDFAATLEPVLAEALSPYQSSTH